MSTLGRDLIRAGSKCALLAMIVTAIGVGVFLTPLSDEHSYLLADKDKRAAVERAASPKIVLVGGSNLAFSVDSSLMESRLGQPVFNMGVNAGLGLNYMISEVEPSLRRGDTVVLVPEYQLLTCGCADGAVILSLLDVDGTARAHLGSSSWPAIIRGAPPYLRNKLRRIWLWHGLTAPRFDPPYVREAFDDRGDIRNSMRGPAEGAAAIGSPRGFMYLGDGKLSEGSKLLLSNFVARSRARGVSVLVSFPPLPEREFLRQVPAIARLSSELRQVLGSCVISRPSDYVFPDKEFLDTIFHLRLPGKRLRTVRLIADLRRRSKDTV